MSLSYTLLTIAEIAFGALLIWGFWNEDKFVKLEDKIMQRFGLARQPQPPRHRAKITKFQKTPVGHHQGKNCV